MAASIAHSIADHALDSYFKQRIEHSVLLPLLKKMKLLPYGFFLIPWHGGFHTQQSPEYHG